MSLSESHLFRNGHNQHVARLKISVLETEHPLERIENK